ncbi:protein SMALL AUXIN UP-REGULATED RNA 51-like [Mercurialis annua]|uniref:protein SMALL AUXIN UP-REGULATED RNA 51-like n=1 Tax=Mercurialis annua TaxID=3986 RepID=UPI00215F18BA|nr:protein SMALL AUXIN UP-REGULATED RNA 51-like [Mercurialis annua]
MDSQMRTKLKRNLIIKAWERCKSLGPNPNKKYSRNVGNSLTKSKSWHCTTRAPQGCFSVYVGEERQRFVVKAKFANHPLFKMLLEDAESVYGFNSDGPLLIPCDIDLFYKVLAEMNCTKLSCNDSLSVLCSPLQNSVTKRYGSYKMLNSSKMLKLNATV